ncbi:small integral membrane protein 15-like [Equus przewalskii]|uniref:Small integral membrane protein 15 n=1 Tax=Equus przewalskii TaxID=9798 RepID=A0ABM2F1H5_EQUPR|nr:small integral membrane protein 15-like [Equus caballus]XP_008518769.1 PREDICTED: small integral membrane protein 15-like [Equus przewalskii]
MFDIKAWAEYVGEWTAKDPYGFLTIMHLALTPLFLGSTILSKKLAKIIEAREKDQKKKRRRIKKKKITKAKQLRKD